MTKLTMKHGGNKWAKKLERNGVRCRWKERRIIDLLGMIGTVLITAGPRLLVVSRELKEVRQA